MKLKFSCRLFLIGCLVLGLVIVALAWGIYPINEEETPQNPQNIYENKELGFKFSYPAYWGNAQSEYLENPILGFRGRFLGIEFGLEEKDLRATPGISENYFATPLIQAFSNDYEIFETAPPFSEHYNQGLSSLGFCQEFIKKTLANLECRQQIIDGRQVTSVIYAYYLEEGMMGSGEEIYFEKTAFIPLANEEFPGLEANIQIHKIEGENLKFKNQDELKKIAGEELKKISDNQSSVYTQKKVKEFEEFIRSFSFKADNTQKN